MRLAHHSNTTMKCDLPTDLLVSKRVGLGAIEVQARKIDDFLLNHSTADLRALFVEHGVEPVTINALEFVTFAGDGYSKVLDRCRQLSEICAAIGCPVLIAVAGAMPDAETTWDAVLAHTAEVVADLAGIAGGFGVKIGLEPLGFGWSSIRTVRAAYESVRESGCDNTGIIVDACHFYSGGSFLSELDAVGAERILAIHLDDMEDVPVEAMTDDRRLMPGKGALPLAELLNRLRSIGFDGVCSVELFRPDYWEMEPHTVAETAKTAAVDVLSPFFDIACKELANVRR